MARKETIEREMHGLSDEEAIAQSEMMFREAVAFHAAARRLADTSTPFDEQIALRTVPIIVNLALSCELYLKTLMFCWGVKPPIGHDLKMLFSYAPSTELQWFTRYYYGLSSEPLGFIRRLEAVKNAFVDQRYLYEAGKAQENCGFLDVVSSMLLQRLMSGDFEMSNDLYRLLMRIRPL